MKKLIAYYLVVGIVTTAIVWFLLDLKVREFFGPDIVMDMEVIE